MQQHYGGMLQAEAGIEWARKHTDSALHAALEWDDEKAGQQHRLWQMRALIAIHVVNIEGQREMVSLTIDRVQPGGGYRDIQDVLKAPPLREILLADALRELERVRLKFETLQELAEVWTAIDRVQQKKTTKRQAKTRKEQPSQQA